MSPQKSKIPCKYPNCPKLLNSPGYCPEHRIIMGPVSDQWHYLYNSNRWRKYRDSFLKKNPLCAECKRKGRINPANEIDHVIPHRGDLKLFWNPNNHQPICKQCHGEKTISEIGIISFRYPTPKPNPNQINLTKKEFEKINRKVLKEMNRGDI